MQGEESWKKVAVILAAIDRSLGIDLNVAIRNIKKDGSTKVGNDSTCTGQTIVVWRGTCRPERQASSAALYSLVLSRFVQSGFQNRPIILVGRCGALCGKLQVGVHVESARARKFLWRYFQR